MSFLFPEFKEETTVNVNFSLCGLEEVISIKLPDDDEDVSDL